MLIAGHTNHIYRNWTYNDRMGHIESCACGVTGSAVESHMIRSADSGQRYVRCLGCNYLLDLDYDIVIVLSD